MYDVISTASFMSPFKVDETLQSWLSHGSLIFHHSFHTMYIVLYLGDSFDMYYLCLLSIFIIG
jgi:hypothetical protein